MHPTFPVSLLAFIFFELARTAISTCAAAIVLFVIALLATKKDVSRASGSDKIVALANLCFALPLAVFGAEHFSAAQGIMTLVPKFMPWPLFWTYFVGAGLLAGSLSIATKILVQWSGLLFGLMMFLFVAMMDIPSALQDSHNRIAWILLCRELSFGAGGWLLAAAVVDGWSPRVRNALIMIGRLIVGAAAVFYGVQHFFHPTLAPGVPLEKPMAAWIPARPLIGYLTGVILLFAGLSILFTKKRRLAATALGAWLLALVLFVYGPMLISALQAPGADVQVEGVNYFFDTLLYAGTILALASASPRTD
jgi:uncharacterized membrane protein